MTAQHLQERPLETFPPTGIEVVTKYVPMAFMFGFFPVKTVINGAEHAGKWGARFFPLSPGHYTVGCSVNYMFTKRCGWNTVEVDLYPGQVVRVAWNAPDTVFQKGWMRTELIASAPVQPSRPPLGYSAPPAGLCRNCFAPLAPGAAACPGCGTTALAAACPGCGGPDTGTRCCVQCGRPLRV